MQPLRTRLQGPPTEPYLMGPEITSTSRNDLKIQNTNEKAKRKRNGLRGLEPMMSGMIVRSVSHYTK